MISQTERMVERGVLRRLECFPRLGDSEAVMDLFVDARIVMASMLAELGTSQERVCQLREAMIHLLAWAGQSQSALTSRQVADAVMTMCQDALDSEPPALANSGKEENCTAKLPTSFTASTLRLIADHFDAHQGKKIIISPSSQMREEGAILLNQIADELEGG